MPRRGPCPYGSSPCAASDLRLTPTRSKRSPAPASPRCPSRSPRTSPGSCCTVEDFADDALLADMGIDDPFDLTGIYQGLPIGDKSVEHSGTLPDRITLYPPRDPRRMGRRNREPRASRPPHLGARSRPPFRPVRRRHARARASGVTALLRFDGVTCVRGGRLLFEGLDLALEPGEALHRHRPQRQRQVEPDPPRRRPAPAGAREPSSAARLALADDALALDRELPLDRALGFWAALDGIGREALDAMGLARSPTCRCGCCRPARRAAPASRGSSRRVRRLWLLDEPPTVSIRDGLARLDTRDRRASRRRRRGPRRIARRAGRRLAHGWSSAP